MPLVINVKCEKCLSDTEGKCSCYNWEINKGDSIQFQLQINTDPAYTNKLTHEWTFKDKTYKLPSLPPKWTRDPILQLYTVNTTDLSDDEFASLRGIYKFKVFHSFDNAGFDINVQVVGVTPGKDAIIYELTFNFEITGIEDLHLLNSENLLPDCMQTMWYITFEEYDACSEVK